MRLSLICICPLVWTSLCFSQVTPDVELGDARQTVVNKIRNDYNFQYYTVSESKEIIRVTIKANCGLDEGTLQMYQFANDHLLRVYNVSSTNPHGMWRTLYQIGSEKNGAPLTTRIGNTELFYWKLDPKPRGYFYFAYSAWFQQECLFLLTTNEKFDTKIRSLFPLLK